MISTLIALYSTAPDVMQLLVILLVQRHMQLYLCCSQLLLEVLHLLLQAYCLL